MGIIPIAFKHTYNTEYNSSNIRKKIHHEHRKKVALDLRDNFSLHKDSFCLRLEAGHA